MAGDEWSPTGFNPSVPSPARMYDHMFGGKDNFAVDRAAVAKMLETIPDLQLIAVENRQFLGRAVRLAAENGVRQFIDLGAGLPTQGHVHEVASEIITDPRVVYIDNDPVAAAHARALLAGVSGAVTVLLADLRDADIIFAALDGSGIDFSEPVGVLLVSVLHFINDDAATQLIAGLRERMTTGSYLILSHAVKEAPGPADPNMEEAYAGSNADLTVRTSTHILSFFDGFEIVPHHYPGAPGLLVDVRHWRNPAATVETNRSDTHLVAAVGIRK
jgi:O-methyltransferase involved in polyketide biosynthesis